MVEGWKGGEWLWFSVWESREEKVKVVSFFRLCEYWGNCVFMVFMRVFVSFRVVY